MLREFWAAREELGIGLEAITEAYGARMRRRGVLASSAPRRSRIAAPSAPITSPTVPAPRRILPPKRSVTLSRRTSASLAMKAWMRTGARTRTRTKTNNRARSDTVAEVRSRARVRERAAVSALVAGTGGVSRSGYSSVMATSTRRLQSACSVRSCFVIGSRISIRRLSAIPRG